MKGFPLSSFASFPLRDNCWQGCCFWKWILKWRAMIWDFLPTAQGLYNFLKVKCKSKMVHSGSSVQDSSIAAVQRQKGGCNQVNHIYPRKNKSAPDSWDLTYPEKNQKFKRKDRDFFQPQCGWWENGAQHRYRQESTFSKFQQRKCKLNNDTHWSSICHNSPLLLFIFDVF